MRKRHWIKLGWTVAAILFGVHTYSSIIGVTGIGATIYGYLLPPLGLVNAITFLVTGKNIFYFL